MPYYQYRCNECENEFEKRQRMSDEPLTVCPVCNGRIRRVVNSVGVVFKGSGFYINDARSNGSQNGTAKPSETKSTETTAAATTSEKTSDSSESKSKEPATTSDSK